MLLPMPLIHHQVITNLISSVLQQLMSDHPEWDTETSAEEHAEHCSHAVAILDLKWQVLSKTNEKREYKFISLSGGEQKSSYVMTFCVCVYQCRHCFHSEMKLNRK